MGKIISVSSQKGGVGKTTTVLNLGFSLSRLGHKVLVMEDDPEGALTITGDLKKYTQQGMIQLLRKRATFDQVVVLTGNKNMSMVGSGARDPSDALYLDRCARNGRLGRMIRRLGGFFDYILIDTPTGINNISVMSLANSHGVIIPVNCKALTVQTLSPFLTLIQRVREKMNADLRVEGLLITMVDNRSPKEIETYETIRDSFPLSVLFKNYIPFDECFEEATTEGLPVALVSKGEQAFHSFMDLAEELKNRELDYI